jgi:hypothetical protein
MKKIIPALSSVLIATIVSIGCTNKEAAFETDLPAVEFFVVERISDGSPFTHSVEYAFVFPEGLDSLLNFPPMLWNDGGSPEGESINLSRLQQNDKAVASFHTDGRRMHAKAKYDLSGLLSLEHTNYIRIQAGGKNGKIKSVSIPIEK